MDNGDERVLFIRTGKTLSRELLCTFKAECYRRNKSMTQVIARLMRKWIEQKQKRR